jgi:phosphatidylglycerol---prolipoprotein diacylglyceryl transferase
MRPLLLDVPLAGGFHLALPAYGTLLVVGMLTAAWVSGRHGRLLGVKRLDMFDLGLGLLAGGLLGAHLLYVAQYPEAYRQGFVAGLRQGGLVYYGGLAAAFAVIFYWSRRRGLPYVDVLDFVAPLGALGLAVTRLGCFFNGCCFGTPSEMPWAVVFPLGSLAHQAQVAAGLVATEQASRPVHPVQLYEFVAALGFFWVLWSHFPRRHFPGEVVAAFGLLYGTWRLFAETLRADSPGWRPGTHVLTVNQWLSLAVIAIAGIGWWTARHAARPVQNSVARPKNM